jgi:hypothetical protein
MEILMVGEVREARQPARVDAQEATSPSERRQNILSLSRITRFKKKEKTEEDVITNIEETSIQLAQSSSQRKEIE